MNKYFFSLVCLTIFAITPACKKTTRANNQEKIKTTIELDNNIVEINNDETTTIVKF